MPWLSGAVKFFGGAYLFYLGVSLWRTNGDQPTNTGSPFQSSLGAAYVRGLLTNLANPKSVVYFGSIFALFMSPGTPRWVEATAIGIVILILCCGTGLSPLCSQALSPSDFMLPFGVRSTV